jgi:hypothetical protein
MTLLPLTLAWRPFLDPIDAHRWWYLLLIPLALGVSMAYKAVRTQNLRRYPIEVVIMTGQVVLGMIALAAASYILVELFARTMQQ